MKKLALSFTVAAALIGVSATSASAVAIPDLEITRVGYNANGADDWTNRNQEYVDVTNPAGGSPVNVKGLIVQDSWAKNNGDDNPKNCNTWTVNTLPGITIPTEGDDAGKLMLPAGHTIRVYTGTGTPAVFGDGGRFHAVYKNSVCGYHGHYLNNGGDTVWITLGADFESFSYNFENGYYVR